MIQCSQCNEMVVEACSYIVCRACHNPDVNNDMSWENCIRRNGVHTLEEKEVVRERKLMLRK